MNREEYEIFIIREMIDPYFIFMVFSKSAHGVFTTSEVRTMQTTLIIFIIFPRKNDYLVNEFGDGEGEREYKMERGRDYEMERKEG